MISHDVYHLYIPISHYTYLSITSARALEKMSPHFTISLLSPLLR